MYFPHKNRKKGTWEYYSQKNFLEQGLKNAVRRWYFSLTMQTFRMGLFLLGGVIPGALQLLKKYMEKASK